MKFSGGTLNTNASHSPHMTRLDSLGLQYCSSIIPLSSNTTLSERLIVLAFRRLVRRSCNPPKKLVSRKFIALYFARLVQGNARHNRGHIEVTHFCFAIDMLGVARLDCLQVSPQASANICRFQGELVSFSSHRPDRVYRLCKVHFPCW